MHIMSTPYTTWGLVWDSKKRTTKRDFKKRITKRDFRENGGNYFYRKR